jgi:multicomponent Na+:H+ antiporter subunit A
MGTLLVTILAAVFVAAALSPWLHRRLPGCCGLLLSLVPLTASVGFAVMLPGVAEGTPVSFRQPWVPSLGIDLNFYVDGLSMLFLLLISVIGTFVTWYAAGYLAGKKDLGKFYLYLFGFMGSMLGVVSADHLVLLFIFWELTSISSYLLIGFYHNESRSRAAALQALLVTGAGGLAMLAGIILLGRLAGTYEVSALLRLDPLSLVNQPGFAAILVLFLLGAFTKSAQFPFHFWLPNAMAAPAPVSAYLHSATMVKAGVFLLARLHPLLSASPWWLPIVAPVGAITMMTGVFLALGQNDLKKILAYTTVAVLGTLTMLLGIGTELAVKAAMAYLLAHALYKAALFMTSGSVDHETGSRDPDVLGGLRRAMPFTAAAALIGAFSMAGLPLLLGFVSKEYFYKALLDAQGPGVLWELLGVSASVAMVALAITAGIKPFWGAPRPTPKPAHEAPWTMWLGPLLLGVASLKAGLMPGIAGMSLVGPAAAAVLGDAAYVADLKLWHGWTVALALSAATLVLGLALYFVAPRLRAARGLYDTLGRFGPERAYESLLENLLAFARWQTRVLQNGYLRNYILTIALFTIALIGWLLPGSVVMPDWDAMLKLHVLTVTVCLLIMAGAIFACLTSSRFNAILALGVVGLGVAMIFFMFSAPDLAMTQVLVETLTLVLFVLAFYRLPVFKQYSKKSTRLRDALVAVVFGVMMTLLVLLDLAVRMPQAPISRFMGETSLELANGRNVVNVILVDFRALDTLGEISVLAIAALGVWAMLRMRPAKKAKEDHS